eukprot:768028-Hanusia_phi.AAC.2
MTKAGVVGTSILTDYPGTHGCKNNLSRRIKDYILRAMVMKAMFRLAIPSKLSGTWMEPILRPRVQRTSPDPYQHSIFPPSPPASPQHLSLLLPRLLASSLPFSGKICSSSGLVLPPLPPYPYLPNDEPLPPIPPSMTTPTPLHDSPVAP